MFLSFDSTEVIVGCCASRMSQDESRDVNNVFGFNDHVYAIEIFLSTFRKKIILHFRVISKMCFLKEPSE